MPYRAPNPFFWLQKAGRLTGLLVIFLLPVFLAACNNFLTGSDVRGLAGSDQMLLEQNESALLSAANAAGGSLLIPSSSLAVFDQLPVGKTSPHLSVYSILQDRRGFLWFGREDGLYRYDGNDFMVFRHELDNSNSPSADTILNLYQDSQGLFWISSASGFLDRYNPETGQWTHFQYDPDNPGNAAAHVVTAISEGNSGDLWFGTASGILSRFDTQALTWSHFNIDAVKTIFALNQEESGTVWAATDAGLVAFDPQTQTSQTYRDDEHSDIFSFTALMEDHLGGLWLGSYNGVLAYFNRQTKQFTFYIPPLSSEKSNSEMFISTLIEDQAGDIWAGTSGSGLFLFDPDTQSWTHYHHYANNPESLSSDYILALVEDHSGILWVGTLSGGLNRLDRKGRFALYQPHPNASINLSDNYISAVLEDSSGRLWAGTVENGVYMLDRSTWNWVNYRYDPDLTNGLNNNTIYALLEDQDGMLWIGTGGGGLNLFNPRTGRWVHYRHHPQNNSTLSDDTVSALALDADGFLWVGTSSGGLNHLDTRTQHWTNYSNAPGNPEGLSGGWIYDILFDSRGRLWVAAAGGLSLRSGTGGNRWVNFRHDAANVASLGDDRVYCLLEDSQGRMWAGTHDGGLNLLNESDGSFTRFTTANGLIDNSVYNILEDSEGQLWLSSPGGLTRFDPQTYTTQHYDTSRGLQAGEFNPGAAFVSASGEMFFGGINGLNAFYPQNIRPNLQPPPLVMTGFQVFYEPVEPGEDSIIERPVGSTTSIDLSYKQNVFSFEFAALDYTAPDKNLYLYRLDGLDENWVFAGTRRQAYYTNLQPGQYTFRVRGANNDGMWNEQDLAVFIDIHPPFWKTTWFRISSAALVLLFLALALRLWMQRVSEEQHRLEKQVKLRTRELSLALEERARLLNEVQLLAITDSLTGWFNRRHFFELASLECERTQRSRQPLSLIMLDIDHFKQTNDEYGHLVGDQVLQIIAEVLKRNLRVIDVGARYGGEEFVALLPETDLPHALLVAERLRSQVEETIVRANSHALRLTISLGVTCWDGESDHVTFEQLLEHADKALYLAKHNGRNQVCVWDNEKRKNHQKEEAVA